MGRYIDEKAWKEYDEFDGQEIHAQILIPVPVEKAFDGWISHIWKGIGMRIGGAAILRNGSGRGCVGSIRRVSGGLREEITSSGEPIPNSDQIASISYRLLPGFFPTTHHMGFVRFVPADSASTLVVWEAKIIPSLFGSIFCCGGTILRFVSRFFFKKALESLKKEFLNSS